MGSDLVQSGHNGNDLGRSLLIVHTSQSCLLWSLSPLAHGSSPRGDLYASVLTLTETRALQGQGA